MILTDLLERNARDFGQDVALVELNPADANTENLEWKEYELVEGGHSNHFRSELTWKEFDDKANRIAYYLISIGVKNGDKVAILLMNSIDWLPIYFGILKTGALAVPLNFRYTSEEIAYCLDLADAKILFFSHEFTERVDAVLPELSGIGDFIFLGKDTPSYAISFERLIDGYSKDKPEVTISEQDYAAIYFSSGTTGMPKAILHDHAGLYSAAVTEYTHHHQKKDDVFMLIPPLYHTGAKMHWFGSLMSGGRTVLLMGTNPGWILSVAAQEKISIVWLLVPWARDILSYMEENAEEVAKLDLSSLKLMHIGAQPVPPSLIKRWKEHFPHHEYDTNYGLSESLGPGAVHLGIENIHKVGAIGKAGHEWSTRVVSEDGVDVPRGKVGELLVKGPGVMKEYYKNPEATAESLRDGWLYTGDMAMEDEDGFIFLVDRKKDVIISGGENIYPVQIEDYLHKMPQIKDVAVIGVPDERIGEKAVAIVELHLGKTATEEDIMEFLAELPRYKRPRQIIFDSVPRNPTGKIEKPKLREKYHAEKVVSQQIEGE
ncbi:MAG: AMP-binding protein [Clostridiales Family XIII bacterium]|jgi:acyl-CoA synthetase (AMP-forming)/AMP-acid ligase II|nr:AMP-binding protein [Clostridiales Family XIII bacterium]